jgi:MerR family transcriptional regulator, mercuric resistance operon regulatory protein
MNCRNRVTIGALSKRTGVNIDTVRFYEKVGLLPPPPRSRGGHRIYEESHLARLSFVRRARELGFTLDEVRSLLRLVDGSHYSCAEVRELTLEHLKEVRRKVADLRRLERTLSNIVSLCVGGSARECPIIETLSHPRQARRRAPARGRKND